jgi:hypothetical protein
VLDFSHLTDSFPDGYDHAPLFVLSLTRPVATTGPDVMREQVDKLIEAAARPNITLQVLPLAAGLHPAVYGPFRIFRFDFDGRSG